MKSLEDRISRVVEGGFSSSRFSEGGPERDASERYNDFLFRSRLSRVANEAVKRNAFVRGKESWRFPSRYIESVKFPDGHVLRLNRDIREAFLAYFWHRIVCPPAWSPDKGVSQLFSRYPSPSGGESGWLRGVGYGVWSRWCIEAGRPQQDTGTRWLAEEMRQTFLGRTRRLQAYNLAKYSVKDFGHGSCKPTAACCQ